MTDEIPYIQFKSRDTKIEGIEIITIEDIISRKDNLSHSPEKAHQIKFYKIVFYTNGVTEHLVDFIWHKVQKNTLIYLSKGQINAFKFTDDVKGYVILFTEEYFRKRLSYIPNDTVIRLFTSHLFSPKIQVPEASNVISYIILLFNEFYALNGHYNKENIISSLYTIIFSKIEELKKSQTHYLKESDKLIQFLDFQKNLKEDYRISRNADYYAGKMNITYKHLNIVCKEVINTTAKQFIDEFVILEAKRNLINSNIKSTELAYLLGFEESTNFTKYFKKHTGLTPNRFKKEHI